MLDFNLWHENEDLIDLYEVKLEKHVSIVDLEYFSYNLFWSKMLVMKCLGMILYAKPIYCSMN